MSKPQHPELERLIGYVESPRGKSDRSIALHLACCKECRVHVSNLMQLQQQVKAMAGANTSSSENVLSEEDEKAIVGNHLDSEQIRRLKKNKQRLKAALYLSSQINAMESAEASTPTRPTQANRNSVNFTTWWQKISAMMPQWEYAALAASLTLAVIFGINLMQRDTQTNIVAYSDNPVVVFKQVKRNTPGIGFFSDAVNVSKPYNGVSVRPRGDKNWLLEWPKIDGAENYLLQLYRVTNGKHELLFEKRTMNTNLLISDLAIVGHTRYEWKLSGNTSNQRRFNANGGFVLQ